MFNQTVVKVVPINETLWEEQIKSHEPIGGDEDDEGADMAQYEYMLENLREVVDYITDEIHD